ncbi:hypothetical protein MMC25_005692 [Agyrium rufum]|nr:hypothetical protein [Agyrium rufum]
MTEPPSKRARRTDSSAMWDENDSGRRSPEQFNEPFRPNRNRDRGDRATQPTEPRRRSRSRDKDYRRRDRSYSREKDDRKRPDDRKGRDRDQDRERERDVNGRVRDRDVRSISRDRHRNRKEDREFSSRKERRRTRSRSPVRENHATRPRTPPRGARARDRSPVERNPPGGARSTKPPSDRSTKPTGIDDASERKKTQERGTNGGLANDVASTTAPKEKTKSGGDAMAIDDDEDPEIVAMRNAMGFAGFKSTKNTKIPGNNVGEVRKEKKAEYRQYMNRVGGFNRPLSPSR